jgi:hypothetical protein
VIPFRHAIGCLGLVFFLLPRFAGAAATQMVYFGDDFKENSGLSLMSFATVAEFAKTKGISAEYFYSNDKELPKSRQAAAERTGQTPLEFNQKNWSIKLAALKEEIEEGKIPSGQQLMLVIDAHGEESGGEFLLKSRSISIAPERELKALVKAAEEKGVHLAIVADPCFSGRLLNLAGRSACVITGSQPGQVGFYSDSTRLFQALAKSPNLEAAFLASRENPELFVPAQPSISTPAGLKTQAVLSALAPYLSYTEGQTPGASSGPCDYRRDETIQSLQQEIGPLVRPLTLFGFKLLLNDNGMEELAKAATLYNKFARDLQEDAKRRNANELRCFKTPLPIFSANGFGMFGPSAFGNLPGMAPPWKNAEEYQEFRKQQEGAAQPGFGQSCVGSVAEVNLQIKFHQEKLREAMESGYPEAARKELEAALDVLEKLRQDPILQKQKSIFDDSEKQDALKGMLAARKEIEIIERRVYSELYQKFSAEAGGRGNPCKDFSL